MRTLTLLLVQALLMSSIFAQKVSADKVPTAVKSAFQQKYPTVQKVVWGIASPIEYAAIFKIGKEKSTAIFSKEGKWNETSLYVSSDQLPPEILQCISKQFTGYEVVEAQKIEVADKEEMYKVTIEKKDKAFELQMTPKGEILKKLAITESDE